MLGSGLGQNTAAGAIKLLVRGFPEASFSISVVLGGQILWADVYLTSNTPTKSSHPRKRSYRKRTLVVLIRFSLAWVVPTRPDKGTLHIPSVT